jgi:hypothetical protein
MEYRFFGHQNSWNLFDLPLLQLLAKADLQTPAPLLLHERRGHCPKNVEQTDFMIKALYK